MANDREILETRGVLANGTSSWAAQDFKPSYGFDNMARFQQKHLREKEQRLLELYDQRQQRAYHIASKGSAGSVNGLNKPKDPAMERQTVSRSTTIMRETSSNGKVQQMFDDRRQATVKGIDRSHPLEPLDNKPNNRKRITNSNTTPSYVTSNRSSAATRQVVTVKRVVRADHNSNAKGVEQTDSSNKSYSLQYNQTIGNLRNGNIACLPINQNGCENEQTDGNKTERAEALEKVQLMDHDRNGKRVTNDLESEGLTQDPANLASNKLPITRSAANKSSAAETKLERFRASNIKGDGVTVKTTFTKKQPEVPSVSYRNTNSSSVQQFARRASVDTNKTQGVSTKRSVVQKQSVETKTKEVKSLGRVVPRPNKLLSEKKYKKISEDLLPEDAVQDKIQQDFISTEHKNNGLTRNFTNSTLYSSKDELRSPSSLSSDSNTSRGNYQTSVTKKPGTLSKAKSQNVQSQNSPTANIGDDILAKCKICGRNFAQERVARHEQICEKSAQKKRRQFDSVMCRVKGTEMESFVNKKGTKKESKVKKTSNSSNWRKKHEDFINAIRSAKQVQAHLAAGGKLSDLPPPPVSDNSDYIQCPHCNRKFNVPAAERHIPVCERMKHNKPNPRAPPKPRR